MKFLRRALLAALFLEALVHIALVSGLLVEQQGALKEGSLHPDTIIVDKLRFKADGTFRIAHITDLHYGEGPATDTKSDRAQQTLLKTSNPDLVVFGGDMVSGYAWKGEKNWFKSHWQRLIGPVLEAERPYASILGNHDGEADLSRREIIELDIASGQGLSFTRQAPSQTVGASNYYLDIFDQLGRSVKGRIWFLDSMNKGCGDIDAGWGCVEKETVDWVERAHAYLPKVETSIAFIHIPLPEFRDLWRPASKTNGSRDEAVACPVLNTGLFDLAKKIGIGGIYCGHDHNNDYYGVLEGVRLGFGRKAGYGGYGPPEGWLRGSRVIELKIGEHGSLSSTWIAQEDGTLLSQTESTQEKVYQEECPSKAQ